MCQIVRKFYMILSAALLASCAYGPTPSGCSLFPESEGWYIIDALPHGLEPGLHDTGTKYVQWFKNKDGALAICRRTRTDRTCNSEESEVYDYKNGNWVMRQLQPVLVCAR